MMRELNPFVLRDDLHQVLFDFDGVGIFCEVEAIGQALDVGIDDDSGGDAEDGTEDDVGGFTCGTRDGDQLFYGLRDLAAVLIEDPVGRADQRFGFVVEEDNGLDVFGQDFGANCGEVLEGGIFGEQARRDYVDADIGALSREYGGGEQFPRIGVMEGAGDVGIGFVEEFEDAFDARFPLYFIFGFLGGRHL